MSTTILLHALAKGATEDWQADLIADRPDTAGGRASACTYATWSAEQALVLHARCHPCEPALNVECLP